MTSEAALSRFYDLLLHPRAELVQAGDWSPCRFLLLVSFRRNGRAVSTPVWFAQHGASLYASTDAASGKVKRIRRNPVVLIAPCSVRGKPLGPAQRAHARLLDGEAAAQAEAILAARYGRVRRIYRELLPASDPAYLELTHQ